jgi:prepilin-type N-terminal cleavage/methylation domain-containing protein
MYKSKSGFTIVELLIVIVVIGILAAIVIVAYTGVQQKARDAQRRSDLSAIAKAVAMRSATYDTPLRYGDTCTAGGAGFFNQTGTSLTGTLYGSKSALNCLQAESNTTGNLTDPSGATSCVTASPNSCFVYMFAACATSTYIYAHLESLPASSTATDSTCQTAYDTDWGMNYVIKI